MNKFKSRFTKPSPYDSVNIFARIFLLYTIPLLLKGVRNNGLKLTDIHRCPSGDETDKVLSKLEKNWKNALLKIKSKQKPSFAWILFKTYLPNLIWPFISTIIFTMIFQLPRPLLLSRIIRYCSADSAISYRDASLSAICLCASTLLYTIIYNPHNFIVMHLSIRIRSACCALIYRKSLSLSRTALGQTQVGQVINLMSNDLNRFDDLSTYYFILIVAPLQSVVIIYILWLYLGNSAFISLVVFVLYLPYQSAMAGMFAKVRLGIAQLTDTRLRYMNEIVSGVKLIKMYVWERPFAEKVAEARRAEVAQIRKSFYLRAINIAIYNAVSRLILFSVLIVYLLVSKQHFTADQVFVSISLLAMLRMNLMYFFPQAVSIFSEIIVACKRIETFLLLEEKAGEDVEKTGSEGKYQLLNLLERFRKQKESYVRVTNIFATWRIEDRLPTLKNVSFDLKSGDLLAVIGPVGSGKSSLLMTLLKEFPIKSGKITMEGSISYASQDPWTFQDSVRNNILFGLEFDEVLYEKTLEVCALKRDLKLMPFGDLTLVGEKGVQLSGGQKARINLARAVYRNADVVLLDDPLSAVDAPVAKHIFERCILEHLKSKIRILVTHQIQFIVHAQKVLVLNPNGQQIAYGSYTEILQKGINFMALLDHYNAESSFKIQRTRTYSTESQRPRTRSQVSFCEIDLEDDGHAEELEDHSIQNNEETSESGTVKADTYWIYLKAGSGFLGIAFYFTMIVLSQANFNGIEIYLSYWSNQNRNLNSTAIDQDAATMRGIIIYSILIGLLFVVVMLRAMTHFIICMKSSIRFHNDIFTKLLRTPMEFFDLNPSGRIFNRFSGDLGIVDEKVPMVSFEFFVNVSTAIGSVITISIGNWTLIIPSIILFLAMFYLRQIFIYTARDAKRFEGMTRSPIFSHVSTTFHGLASIRAYRAQVQLEQQFHQFQNDQTATMFIYRATSRAIAMAMDITSSLYICVITAAVMVVPGISGGIAGLIISTGLSMSATMQFGVRQSAEFESLMTSVERVNEYRNLPQEAPAKSIKDAQPPADWPTGGQIEFHNLCMSYTEGTFVLKDLNCIIRPGEKIGIVGRTGAGKSSIISALFRLNEPIGTILIDGIDTKTLGLDDLRQRIAIIPQDPVVFTGTIRYNLDPFSEYSDDDLWLALEKVQLKSTVTNYALKLEEPLVDCGATLSVGQRQLICLARAILQRNRILVLDEATAHVDHQTDSLIQKTIRTEFEACTVLTVAHRLNTVIDSSRILVLDAGRILEFDRPFVLLKQKGVFYEMAKKTGAMYGHLVEMAKNGQNLKTETSEN